MLKVHLQLCICVFETINCKFNVLYDLLLFRPEINVENLHTMNILLNIENAII